MIKNKQCSGQENDGIIHSFVQIKVSRVPLWIVHCHLCIKGHLKYAYSPIKEILKKFKREPS